MIIFDPIRGGSQKLQSKGNNYLLTKTNYLYLIIT